MSEEISKPEEKPSKPRYDFFTVLPEMEVVVPAQELARQREHPDVAEADNDTASYLLHAEKNATLMGWLFSLGSSLRPAPPTIF